MNIHKWSIKAIFLCLFVASLLCGCAKRQEQPNEQTYGESAIDSVTDSTSTKLQTVNPFEGVTFMFSGWEEYGELIIQTDECSEFIKETFDFELDNNTNGKLSNGSIVKIRAIYDSQLLESHNYSLETDSITVVVSGLTELISTSNYSEEKAWIQYVKDGESYLACIDKHGNILFQFVDGLNLQANLFSNGCAHITHNDGTIFVIDAIGTVLSTYSLNSTGEVLAYGDGYTLTEKHISSFDEAYDEYRIYDKDGSIVEAFHVVDNGVKKKSGVRSATYCGMGVFAMDIPYGGGLVWYYCAENGSWVDHIDGSMKCKFYDEIAWIDSDSTDKALVYLTSTGEIEKVTLPTGTGIDWNWFKECYVKDGVCLIWMESIDGDYMLNYDFLADTYTFIDEKYLSKVDWDVLSDEATFDNGYIFIPMKGSDGKSYFAVFDKQWNAIIDPTVYNNLIGFSEDRLIVKQNGETNIYSFTGELVFTLSEKNISSISAYSNGVAYTSGFYYVDLNGDVLFDNIFTDGIEASALDDIA